MKYFYHYTLESHISNITRTGMSPNNSSFTTREYYNENEAGQECGVQAHYIDCVLKFADDGGFRYDGTVSSTGRFNGGADQWSHASHPKPIAKRKISERSWTSLKV